MAAESVLRRLDRMLGSGSGNDAQPCAASASGFADTAPGELEELFAFWARCDAAVSGAEQAHAARRDRAPPTHSLMILSAAFVCAASAGAVSMVMPYRPSVSQITDFFATSVPGYAQVQGIPIVQRTDPLADGTGLRAGSFIIRPTLDTGFGYDDNVLGERGSPGSTIFRTSPTLAINSDWSRNALGAYLSADTAQYLDTPNQTRTDWTAALGGTYTIGRGDLTFAYSHLALHEDSTYVDAILTTTPLAFTVDDWRASYAIKLGALTLTPNIDLSTWRFGTATIGNRSVSESSEDHDVLQGGLATAYDLSGRTTLLTTASLIESRYLHAVPGTPAPSAFSALAMAGFDYRYSGALRLRAMLGGEAREFESAAYRSRVAPIGQATIIWTPTGLTTVTTTLARTLEDAIQADTGGYTYTRADLEVDHELLRNLILQSHLGVQDAQSLQQSGSQTSVYGGLSAIWRINRTLSLTMSYQYATQTGQSGNTQPGTATTSLGAYTRNVVDVRLRAAL